MDSWIVENLVAASGWLVAAATFGFSVFKHYWDRKNSRHDVLARILLPMTKCAQSLMLANNARRTRDQMLFSYPDSEDLEIATRADQLLKEYRANNEISLVALREAEVELGASSFRFPIRLARAISTGISTLSELGRLVNAGIHHKAELELAKYRDDYKNIAALARGWELSGPFDRFREKRRKEDDKQDEKAFEFNLSQKEIDRLLELFHKRATTEADRSFVVHPPLKLVRNPSIAESDSVIDELKDSVFSVVFRGGTSEMLALHELVAFVHQLIMVEASLKTATQSINPNVGKCEIQIQFDLRMRDLMRPEMVKLILTKVAFSDRPSDAEV